MTNGATKMSESAANCSEKPQGRLKAWADSLHELRLSIAEAERACRHPSENLSPPCASGSLAP